MTNDNQNKIRWLRPTMNGTDDEIAQALLDSLPTSESLSAADMQQMEKARAYMAELFLRSVACNTFMMQSGMTGFPIDPVPPGAKRHELIGKANSIYFKFWLLDKDPATSAQGIKTILRSRQDNMPEEHRGWFTLQLVIDIDSDDSEYHGPLEVGLTPSAICMEVSLSDVDSLSGAIDQACLKLSPQAHQQLRFTLGSFGQQEYEGMSTISLFSKRIPYNMGSEWLLFKNIRRRAGKFGWFWQALAKRRNRKDN